MLWDIVLGVVYLYAACLASSVVLCVWACVGLAWEEYGPRARPPRVE
jgi:hypothetical protein